MKRTEQTREYTTKTGIHHIITDWFVKAKSEREAINKCVGAKGYFGYNLSQEEIDDFIKDGILEVGEGYYEEYEEGKYKYNHYVKLDDWY